MVAIFVGAGSGFERSSANLLGGAGQLGGGLIGRGGENVSVNAFSGNLIVNHQDEFLIGRGPDVGISRTYNSLADAADGDNGDQWQQSTHRRVFGLAGTLGTAGSTISRLGGDGAVLVYSWDDTAGAYVSTEGAGAHDQLSYSGGEWTWTDGDSQVTETYSAHGTDNWRIAAKTDRDGNALTFTYTGDKLDTVTTADGAWTQYVWAGNNITEIVTGYTDLATSTANTLTRTRYAHDASDRLVTVTTDLTPEDNSVGDSATYVTAYTYDGASNRIASISQTDGSLITITYDISGRVETLTQQVASGVTRTTSISYAADHTLVTGPDGQVTKLSYDAQGRLTGIELPPAATGATPQTVGFSYDADGNLASVTDGEGAATTYQYDANGNAVLVTDPNNNTVERTFDAANRLVTERLLGSDKHNSGAAHYSQYVYDGEGHLRYAIDASGGVVEYEYSAAGELLREIAYPAHKFDVGAAALTEAGMDAWVAGLGDLSSAKIVEHTYDARGGRISTTSYSLADSAGEPLSGSAFRAVYQTYDQAGRLVATHREGQAAQSYVYDGMGRLIASTDLDGGTTNIAFNDAGLQTTVTTASGYVSVSVFNQAGELVSLAESGTFLGGGTSTYGYDQNGRMRVATDASGRSSYFVYDHAGRKVADIDHLGGMVEYVYDQAGRIVATVQRANLVSQASLALLADPENGLELASFAPSASAEDQWSFNIYDDVGRTIRSIDGEGGVAAFEYDQSDRLIGTTYFATELSGAALDALKLDPLGSFTDPAAHADDAVSRLFYDEAGRLVGALDGEGYLTESVYDSAGQKVADIAYSAKASGDLANAVFGELRASVDASQTRVARYIYDGQGQLAYTLDALGGLTSYSYDAAGNLVSQTRHARPVTPASFDMAGVQATIIADAADRTSWSVYDDAGRLAYSVDAEGGVAAFAYDTSGRMIKSVQFANLHGAISSLPALSAMEAWAADPAQAGDSANRVTRNWYNERGDVIFTVDAESYVKGYTYDETGRLLSESAWPDKVVVGDATSSGDIALLAPGAGDAITISYTYDGAGRLLTATDGEGYVTRYVYDAMGQRTDAYQADNMPGETVRTHYVYDNAGRLTEQHSDYDPGNPNAIDATVTYAYDGLGNRVAVTDPNGNTTTFAYDALGQVVQSTNALNGVTAYEYDAFGNVVKTTDPRGEHTYLYYDRLGRLVAERDAEDYLTRTHYDRFGDIVLTERYALPVGTPAETGVVSFVTDGVSNELPATPGEYLAHLQSVVGDLDDAATDAETAAVVTADSATAAAQTAAADAAIVADLQAQLAALPPFDSAAVEAERQAALADMYPWAQNRIAELDTQIAALPSGPERSALESERDDLQSRLWGLQFGITFYENWYTDYINDYYDAIIASGTSEEYEELEGQIAAAQIVAAASQQAAADAQLAADDAQLLATQRRAQADQAQVDLDAVIADPYYAFAAYLQGIADERDLEADLAEAAAAGLQDTADQLAQAAAAADLVVTGLEGQIANYSGPTAIDFETERAAALADMNNWLNERKIWLQSARNAVEALSNDTNGLEEDVLKDIEDRYNRETSVANDLASPSTAAANKIAYINQYYDNLTWQANNLGDSRTDALADPLTWLTARHTDLANWIDSFASLSGSTRISNTRQEFLQNWAVVHAALYDLPNNTHSTGWPSSNSDVGALFSTVQSNPSYVPGDINHTTQQAADYRAEILINAHFDVLDATGGEYQGGGSSEYQQLLDDLVDAQNAAALAHDAADLAQNEADDAVAAAVPLRTQADEAQSAADAALAAAQNAGSGGSGEPTYDHIVSALDNIVEIDLTSLGDAARTIYSHDRLGRLTTRIDAGGYVETYSYNAFAQLASVTKYELSATATDNSSLPANIQQAYDDAYDLQDQATQLINDADEAESDLTDLQSDATIKRAAANLALAARNAAQQTLNSYPSLQPTFDAYWDALADAPAEIQQQIDYYEDQMEYYALMMQSDPANAQNYFWAGLEAEQQRDAWASALQSVNDTLADQSSYSPGDVLPAHGVVNAEHTAYESLRADRADAQAAYDAAVSDYQAKNSAANAAENALSSQQDTAADLRADAIAKQAEATEALELAQQLEQEYYANLGYVAPTYDLSDLGQAATTHFNYDNRGQLTETTDAADFQELFVYDAFGRRITHVAKSHTDALTAAGATHYEYDKRGLLVKETLPITSHGQGSSFVQNTYDYDARGNLTERVEASNKTEKRTTLYSYDQLDRLTEITHEEVEAWSIDPATKAVSYSSQTPIEQFEYDANGNLIKSIDLSGAATYHFYDELGRKAVEIDALGHYTAYSYDANGNVTNIRVFDNPVTLPSTGGDAGSAPAEPSGGKRETVFAYDGLGRMTSSSVLGVRTGVASGTNWSNGVSDLATTYEYDSRGNVVKLTDPGGNVTWSYYDDLGRKTAQVDGENYLTKWEYDSEGNVVREARYANKVTATIGLDYVPTAISRPNEDRVTEYTYDLVGNRTSEKRLNVKIRSGQGNYTTAAYSLVEYTYNGRGQVLTKTEATGDMTQYDYDEGGRLVNEQLESFSGWYSDTNQNATTTLTPEVDYHYDGLGNLVRTVNAGNGNAAARETQYAYGAGGRLESVTDAQNQVRNYKYDLAGRLVLEHYTRAIEGASNPQEGIGYRYDELGRNTGQAYYRLSGGNWQFQGGNTYTTIAYNAHGDVTGIAFNRTDSQIASLGYQQQNKYDDAGRMWASNSGDGSWKYFGYDKNGNQTLSITSAGYDLEGVASIQAAWALRTQANVNATLFFYDGRNQATKVTETGRQIASTSSTENLTSSRSYNAFGEVASETDADGATIEYDYNTMGRLLEIRSPSVQYTTVTGAEIVGSPTEKFYYDISGRLTAQRDANNNLTRYTLVNGTGYGGSQALIASEIHADGGVVETHFDIHGDARWIENEVGLRTLQTFDKLGQVTKVVHPGAANEQLTEHFAYDILGQRIAEWKTFTGDVGLGFGSASDKRQVTTYDIEGRIVSHKAYGGDVTDYSYVWDASITTPGMATGSSRFGGWTQTITYANDLEQVEKTDLFGRLTHRTDLGGKTSSFQYDHAGRMTQMTINGATQTYAYYNTGLVRQVGRAPSAGYSSDTVTYTYDAVGNLKTEVGLRTPTGGSQETYKNHSASYDALGRLIAFSGSQLGGHTANLEYEYDAAGNILRSYSQYSTIGGTGNALPGAVQEYWYAYDSMNRLVIDRGQLDGVRGDTGTQVRALDSGSSLIEYDAAGRRVASTRTYYVPEGGHWVSTVDPNIDYSQYDGSTWYVPPGMQWVVDPAHYYKAKESYTYDTAGRLDNVHRGIAHGGATPDSVPAPPTGTIIANYDYDILGRMTLQEDFIASAPSYSRELEYNAKSQIVSETINQKRGTTTYTTENTFDYTDDTSGLYLLGSVSDITSVSSQSNISGSQTVTSTYDYTWREGALQDQIVKRVRKDGQTYTTTSDFTYNALGQLVSTTITDGRPRDVDFTLDERGEVIHRQEEDNDPAKGDPSEIWYRFGGKQLGYVSNNGSKVTSYSDSMTYREVEQQYDNEPFRYSSSAVQHADFTGSYEPISTLNQGSSGGSYTVQTGDSLRSIAQAVWGDADLWYKIAEANGLSGDSGLVEGQVLMLPAGIIRNSLNAGTITPYDPGKAVGDLSPLAPVPPAPQAEATSKGGGCGILGKILVAVIAVAVTLVVTAGAAAAFSGKAFGTALSAITGGTAAGSSGIGVSAWVAGGAVGGAVGSAASQGAAIGLGIQEKFNWTGVALGAIQGAIGAGVGVNGAFGKDGLFGAGPLAAGARGAVSSVATQGIALATGLQSKFDFAGVAAAGVGAVAGSHVGDHVKGYGQIGGTLVAGAAGAIANAATRSAIDGTSFGDGIIAAIPDVIGQAVGGALSGAIAGGGKPGAPQNLLAGTPYDGVPIQQGGVGVANTAGEYATEWAEAITEVQNNSLFPEQLPDAVREKILSKIVVEISGGEPVPVTSSTTESGKPAYPSTPTGLSIWLPQLETWRAEHFAIWNANPDAYDPGTFEQTIAAIDWNIAKLGEWNAIADQEIGQMLFAGLGAPALIGGGGALAVAAAPGALTFTLANATRISTGTGIAGEIVTGVPLTVPAATGAGVATLAAAERGAASIWRLGPGPRGEAIEQAFGHNLPGNIPVIDRFNNGIATSIKSIDLDLASYLTGNRLRNTLTGYVDKVAGYSGTGSQGWAGVIIKDNQISSRGLDLVIPHSGTAAQQQVISDIVKYGASRPNPVDVNVFIYP